MRRVSLVVIAVAALLLIGVVWVYAVFHGVFDPGTFVVEQARWASDTQVAIVARRFDHQALSGDEYFVVVASHASSPADLKRAYYHDDIVFQAASDCLNVRWQNARELIVSCTDRSITAGEIEVERDSVRDIRVSYEDIPRMLKK